MNKLKLFLNLVVLFFSALCLCGCATLSYVGDDFNSDNIQTVKTKEDFVFNTYKKTIDNANIKMGITRTPVTELLALYIQIENLSYETPYSFKVEDLRVYDTDNEVQFITTNNYLNIYQAQESASMSSMSMMGATLATMSGISSNYNEFNQTTLQNTNEEANKSAYSRIEEIGRQISAHSVQYSSSVSPRRSQYYYFFFQDNDKFPLTVKYKTLEYQFKL